MIKNSSFIFNFLVIFLFNFFSFTLRNYKKFKVKTYIGSTVYEPNSLFKKNSNYIKYYYNKKKSKSSNSFHLYISDENDFTYEDIEEYLKKNDLENNEDDRKNEILKLINYISTLKNEEEFFSKFGYFNRGNKSVEYYFNQMKNEKERKQRKNYNILNFILSLYLKERNNNAMSYNKNYKNIQSYYYYVNNLINNKDVSSTVQNGKLDKRDNLFSRKKLCNFISFYLKNVNLLKYFSLFCISGILTYSISMLIKNINLENWFFLKNYFDTIYFIKNVKFYEIGIFSLIINILLINKYNQYFCITEDSFSILFNHYFFYEGLHNLNKKNIEEFMCKFNYSLNDVLNSLNDMFSQYLSNKIYTNENLDENTIYNINCFISLYQKLFRNNRENIKNVISLVLNKYHIYCLNKNNQNKDVLSKIFYIFYIINLKFKYEVVDIHKLNIIKENKYKIPFFFKNNKISNYFLLTYISENLNIKEKIINNCLLDTLKKGYENYIYSIFKNKNFSNNVYDDIKKINFITLDSSIIEEVNMTIFMKLTKNIIEDKNYELFYTQNSKNESEKEGNEKYENEDKEEIKDYDENLNEKDKEDKNNLNNKIYINNYKDDVTIFDSKDFIKTDKELEEDNNESNGNEDKFINEHLNYESKIFKDENIMEDENIVENESIFNDNHNIYHYIEDSINYIIDDNFMEAYNKEKVDNELIEKEKKELREKEILLKKLNDIYFLRKYLIIDKEFTNKYIEKYLFSYIYKEYKILINNLIFKKLKNKNDNLFFLKRGISLSNSCTENIIKNIILNFVIKTKENINIFLKLENIDKCLKLVINLINVYKMIKKKRKYLKIKNEFLNLDDLFSFNFYHDSDIMNKYMYDKDKNDIVYEEKSKIEESLKEKNNNIDKNEENLTQANEGNLQNNEEKLQNNEEILQNDDEILENDDEISENDDENLENDEEENLKKNEEYFLKEGEDIKNSFYKDRVKEDVKEKEILLFDTKKKLYEEFVLKYMKNQSERKIFKTIFNLDNEEIDKEIEDNIINKFLEKVAIKYLNNLKNLDMDLKIIGNDNLFNYKNVNFEDFLSEIKRKNKKEKRNINDYKIKKENIFESIDDESFREICRKMYINKLFELKENIYNNRKELYFYEVILDIKNPEEIHDVYLIDEYEKMINDIIKTNILNKNYINIKNMYLKKIINFLNISNEKSVDVELSCIFKQTYAFYQKIKENFYIYKSDEDFINNINEILTIYKNFDLIKKKNDKYYVKFSLIESNYNLVHKIIERYVLYVIDIISNENRLIYKENIFILVKILGVNENIIDEISTKIYKKYVENQELDVINNMDFFFNFLLNMDKEKQNEIVLDNLKKKLEIYLTSNENYQEKLQKVYDILIFINNNLQLKKNVFNLTSLNSEVIYEFLITCIDNYLHKEKSETFITSESDYMNNFNDFLNKIKILLIGNEQKFHFSHILNILSKDIINKAITLLNKFEYDKSIEEIYNLIKLHMIDKDIHFSDIDIEKRKKLVNIFSYQNINDEKKFLYLDLLNKILF
ncbi:conserved Plasmodium protein, unknown function [Plasmodium gallinaceum]|uniref:Uncharacterized protein n=1 Tax=Plasmodium gallinaceum TaxID=5849 RepID=A0A1J1H3F7_PLAGA|nr:conserved Plasmodium protein, unknown function [Plasmodium gallinaceum]CRG98031.1 conserved Plasmodium protein, unknown function [Plasmodium gallinaceum]